MPDSDLVIATVSNRFPVDLGSFLTYTIADTLLDLPTTRDWLKMSVESSKEGTDEFLDIGLETGNHLPKRKPHIKITQPLSAFEGRYSHPLFETISVRREQDELYFTLWDKEYLASHFHENVFCVKSDSASITIAKLFRFITDDDGRVVSLTEVPSIEYKRE